MITIVCRPKNDNYSILFCQVLYFILKYINGKYIMNSKELSYIFGLRIKKLRNDRKLTQERLASLIGVHRTYIGMIERGEKNITLYNIYLLAQAFDLSLCELFKGVTDG